jgi:hypothetical protein
MIRASIAAAVSSLLLAASAPQAGAGELALFHDIGFNGDRHVIERDRPSLLIYWTIGSVAVHPGEKWQICPRDRYQGRCAIVSESVRDSVAAGIPTQILSARRVREGR